LTGSLKLKDHPGDTVRIVCEKCRRRGQYRKGKLIAIYGPDIPLPDLRIEIAQCERDGYPQTWTASRARARRATTRRSSNE
jgi:hypothetical protein